MPRRNRRNTRRAAPRVLPFDFYSIISASTKIINVEDLGLARNRAMRPVSAKITAVSTATSQLPVCYIALYGPSDSDNIAVSANTVLGVAPRTLSVRAPRVTDFGDYASDTAPVLQVFLPGYYSGTITVSGTVWMQFAPHKVTTKVALAQRFESMHLSSMVSSPSTSIEKL